MRECFLQEVRYYWKSLHRDLLLSARLSNFRALWGRKNMTKVESGQQVFCPDCPTVPSFVKRRCFSFLLQANHLEIFEIYELRAFLLWHGARSRGSGEGRVENTDRIVLRPGHLEADDREGFPGPSPCLYLAGRPSSSQVEASCLGGKSNVILSFISDFSLWIDSRRHEGNWWLQQKFKIH